MVAIEVWRRLSLKTTKSKLLVATSHCSKVTGNENGGCDGNIVSQLVHMFAR